MTTRRRALAFLGLGTLGLAATKPNALPPAPSEVLPGVPRFTGVVTATTTASNAQTIYMDMTQPLLKLDEWQVEAIKSGVRRGIRPAYIDMRIESHARRYRDWHTDLNGVDICDHGCFYANPKQGGGLGIVGLYKVDDSGHFYDERACQPIRRWVENGVIYQDDPTPRPATEWRVGTVRLIPPWERGPHSTAPDWADTLYSDDGRNWRTSR